MHRFQYWSVVTALCSAVVASPPVVVGGEGVDQAGNKGRAELGDGVVAPSIEVGAGAINPTGLPPMLRCGWEREAAGTVILFRSHDAEYPSLPWIAWLAMSGFLSVGYTPQTTDICVCRRHVDNVRPTGRQHSVKLAYFFADNIVSGNRIPDTIFYM